MVSLVDVAINFGIIVGYCLGYAVESVEVGSAVDIAPWRVAMAASAAPPLLFALASAWLPESPRWLVERGDDARARTALIALASNGDAAAAERELSSLKAAARKRERSDFGSGSGSGSGSGDAGWRAAMRSSKGRYVAALGVAQQLTGTEVGEDGPS